MNLMKELCMACGISGFEDDVARIMEREFKKYCDEVVTDSFGNVIGKKGNGRKKVMIAAHMDEIGLMVKHIDKDGFINFIKIGGIDDRILQGQRVIIKTKKGDVMGLIGSKPPHLQKDEERKKVIEHNDLFVDIGAKNQDDAKKYVAIGDQIVFEPNFTELKNGLYSGKAVDNRVGCYVLIRLMEKINLRDMTVYGVATAQEEVGLKGARVSSFKIEPDYAIAVDTTIAGGTPMVSEKESSLKIDKGPAITIIEASGRGVITHPRIRNLLIEMAQEKNIPYQIDVLEGGMTDAAVIYMNKVGCPSGVVSIPTRYIHGPTGVFSMKDIESTIELISSALKKI